MGSTRAPFIGAGSSPSETSTAMPAFSGTAKRSTSIPPILGSRGGYRYGTNRPWTANRVLSCVDARPSGPPS